MTDAKAAKPEDLKLNIGLNAITSYKRMAYDIWYALAEFIDNSTQDYVNNKAELDAAYAAEGRALEINITYERQGDDPLWRISDNAMGMNETQLERALEIAMPPENATGRCRYGMGMKTAACWIGNLWTVRTKRLGSDTEFTVTIDVNKIAAGDASLPTKRLSGLKLEDHYTIIEIRQHNREFKGRTVGKIRRFLSSIYRQDFRSGTLTLDYNGTPITWEDFDSRLRKGRDGSIYKKTFEFEVEGKKVSGWAGVLDRGARADAGFSILHADRMVTGWPDAWRPEEIFGQNSNNLLNQRLIGEVHLDDFAVSHTKDDIQWYGDEEEAVEKALATEISDLINVASATWKSQDDDTGPSEGEIDIAIAALRDELLSPEMVDNIEIGPLPATEVIAASFERLIEPVTKAQDPQIRAEIDGVEVLVYLATDLSPNDPYVINEPDLGDKVVVVINTQHPHMRQLHGSEGALNYFRHCIYDALAERAATKRRGHMEPNTIKVLKDRYLRVAFAIEQRRESEPTPPGE